MNKVKESVFNVDIKDVPGFPNVSGEPNKSLIVNSAGDAIIASSRMSDVIVASQSDFNAIFTRDGANEYSINSNINSIVFKFLSGGYIVSDILSGGDTWGYIKTNNCKTLICMEGSYLNFENTKGYVEVNTDDCYLKNVWVQGNDDEAEDLAQSFLLNAYRVVYDGCKVSNRRQYYSAFEHTNHFKGSLTAGHNITSRYVSCSVFSVGGYVLNNGLTVAFRDCYNLYGCFAHDFSTTPGYTISQAHVFKDCINLSNCFVNNVQSTGGPCIGFYGCKSLSACRAEDISTTSGGNAANGFNNCVAVSGCYSNSIAGAGAGGGSGFVSCAAVSGCFASNITNSNGPARGFWSCSEVSGSKANIVSATGGDAIGFDLVDHLSACAANNMTAIGNDERGFRNCTYASASWSPETASGNTDVDPDSTFGL